MEHKANSVVDTDIEKDDTKWWIMLGILLEERRQNTRTLWREFEHEVMHVHRFFPQSELIHRVTSISSLASIALAKGSRLYRLRLCLPKRRICTLWICRLLK